MQLFLKFEAGLNQSLKQRYNGSLALTENNTNL